VSSHVTTLIEEKKVKFFENSGKNISKRGDKKLDLFSKQCTDRLID
jgi:hypothetical protein